MDTNTNKAPRNRTITLSQHERDIYKRELLTLSESVSAETLLNKVIFQDIFSVIPFLPSKFIDLLFIDPPYNLCKTFNNNTFKQMSSMQYMEWMDSWLKNMLRLLKDTSSIYICGDWRSSAAIQLICEKYFVIRNRITFEREKGRGAKNNWKNNSEDIWFCTMSGNFHFDSDSTKLKRKVIAPYRENGTPKDWQQEYNGNFRLTFPSNLWTDITIPFWSMPENTPHPTQKPEKLLAKIILASSKPGDIIFDPFAGVGTSGVVSKKLGRNFILVEIDEEYCLYAQKRLHISEINPLIQGYADGVFWERNTLADPQKTTYNNRGKVNQINLL